MFNIWEDNENQSKSLPSLLQGAVRSQESWKSLCQLEETPSTTMATLIQKTFGIEWPLNKRKLVWHNFGLKQDVTIINWDSKPDYKKWRSQIWKKWWSMTSTKMPTKTIKLTTTSKNWNGTWSTQTELSASCGISWSLSWPFTVCSSPPSSWSSLMFIWLKMKWPVSIALLPLDRIQWSKLKQQSTLFTCLKLSWTSSRRPELIKIFKLSQSTTFQAPLSLMWSELSQNWSSSKRGLIFTS